MYIIIPIIILFAVIFYALTCEPRGKNQSKDFNVTYGTYRVRYRDNKVSMPMCKDVADDYASLFGGQVEKIKKVLDKG